MLILHKFIVSCFLVNPNMSAEQPIIYAVSMEPIYTRVFVVQFRDFFLLCCQILTILETVFDVVPKQYYRKSNDLTAKVMVQTSPFMVYRGACVHVYWVVRT